MKNLWIKMNLIALGATLLLPACAQAINSKQGESGGEPGPSSSSASVSRTVPVMRGVSSEDLERFSENFWYHPGKGFRNPGMAQALSASYNTVFGNVFLHVQRESLAGMERT